jgi:hypothetical protein
MLYGALKNKSPYGILSVCLLFGCSALFFIIPASSARAADLEYIQFSYSGFAELNRNLLNFFGLAQLSPFSPESGASNIKSIFSSREGFIVMRFVAFAYTYHYLNWFSKTSVIQWHKVPKKTLYITLVLWVFSVVLYVIDYNIGLKALYFLSFLHVFLEFPLNITSFQGIIKSVIPVKK